MQKDSEHKMDTFNADDSGSEDNSGFSEESSSVEGENAESYNRFFEGHPEDSLPPVSRLFKWAVSFYRSNIALILGIVSAPFLLGLAQKFWGEDSLILFFVLTPLAFAASYVSYLALLAVLFKKEKTIKGAYKKGLGFLVSAAWISALTMFVTFGGILLLVVPGILLSIWLSLSLYVLFAEDQKGTYALTRSWHYVQGFWASVFGRFLFFGILLILTFLVIGVLSAIFGGGAVSAQTLADILGLVVSHLIFAPLGVIYSYGIYRGLKKIKGSAPTDEKDRQKFKKVIMATIVIGALALTAAFVFVGQSLLESAA